MSEDVDVGVRRFCFARVGFLGGRMQGLSTPADSVI